jgi:hypothetical protein
VVGGSASGETPVKSGPRKPGQFSANNRLLETLKAVRTRRCFHMLDTPMIEWRWEKSIAVARWAGPGIRWVYPLMMAY